MPKFTKKPEIVEAQQWRPGLNVEGVEEHSPLIRVSTNQRWFYLDAIFPKGCGSGPLRMPDAWLTTTPGDELAPFNVFDFRTVQSYPASRGDAFTEKYLKYAGLDDLPSPYAMLCTPAGATTVNTGDWIITEAGGQKHVCKEQEFAEKYEACAE